ncbi:hypothetical protein, partial [Paracoccus sp. (in: a-proteobacteria)]|uniref:hypothetical protein n=1 Tax=Paracoccus sp. TaxID=267 RepID=UPI0035AFE1C6
QKSHVDHSVCLQLVQAEAGLHMGQFSMTILAVAGSILSGNQQWTGTIKELDTLDERSDQ